MRDQRRVGRDGDLRKLFRQHIPDAHWVSIETGMVSPGVPDSEYCFRGGISGWIEFKKTEGNSLSHLKPLQVGWISRRARLGGRVFIGVRLIKTKQAIDDLILFSGRDVQALKAGGLSGVTPLIVSHDGPSRWDWEAIKASISH
jgi:hypothetical protein